MLIPKPIWGFLVFAMGTLGSVNGQTPEALVVPDRTAPSEKPPRPTLNALDIEKLDTVGYNSEISMRESAEPVKRQWIFDMEYLLLATRGMPQTISIAGSTPILGPAGKINSLPSGYESGFRAGIGWISPYNDIETVFRYSYYSNQSDMRIAAPLNGFFSGTPAQASLVPGSLPGALYPTQTVPGLINQVVNGSAQSNYIYNLGDIELAKRWQVTENIGLRFLAGPRIANLNQLFQVQYTGGDVNTADISRQITFNGGGLRVGGSADAVLAGNWGVRLTSSASLVTGNFQGRQTEVANGAAILSTTDRFVSMIPIVDLGIGLNYHASGWNFTLGYEFQNWINVLQGYNFMDDANPSKFQREFGNLGFDGLAFRMNYLW